MTLKKRRCKDKHKKKLQWSQKAKIIVIYSQDIMLDDNTIRFSFFRP